LESDGETTIKTQSSVFGKSKDLKFFNHVLNAFLSISLSPLSVSLTTACPHSALGLCTLGSLKEQLAI
jgi:hypothetical protein